MRNISDTDGLSREKRLERAAAPVILPVLEERFPVLLARALRRSDFISVYQFQSLVVLLEIELLDTHLAKKNFVNIRDEKRLISTVYTLIYRMEDWRKKLEYACLEGGSNSLLRDLSGQIMTNISPMFSVFCKQYADVGKLGKIWYSVNTKEEVEDSEELPRRFYWLLLASIRLLQNKKETYREEIYSLGTMDPSLAVIVAFLNNYQEIVSTFNARWKSLPLFYLDTILKIKLREKIPGTTWFTFVKSPVGGEVTVPKDTYLEDVTNGNITGYRLLSDVQLTQMTAVKVERVILEKKADRYPEAAMGYVTSIIKGTVSERNLSPASIGLRIYSSMIHLNGGIRKVEILFRLTTESLNLLQDSICKIADVQEISIDEAQFKMLYDAFYLYISTENGELPVDSFRIRLKKNTGLQLTFHLSEDFPAIKPLEGDDRPSLCLQVNPSAWLYPYSWARLMYIKSILIQVSVKGLRNIQVYNDLGNVDIHQAFSPFGISGERGAWLAFGNYEMACKPVKEIAFIFNWQRLPSCIGGLKEYYQNYERDIDNTSFRGRIERLYNRSWKPLENNEPFYLFRTSDALVPLKEDCLVERTEIRCAISETTTLPYGQPESFRLNDVRSGFYRLVFTSPEIGFGVHEYRRLFADIMMYNSHAKRKKTLPNEPLSLLMDTPHLNYLAETEYNFSIGNIPDIGINYIRPLNGVEGAVPDFSKPIALIEGPEDEGNLVIGIANAVGENLISLYLELELLQREIDHTNLPSTDWFYRDASRWIQIDSVHVLRDDTGNLMHSGAVMLQFPFCITPEMTDVDGLFWICVAVHSHLSNCSKVRVVYMNVAEAKPVDTQEIKKSIPGLLSYSKIVPLQGECPPEDEIGMRTRISERIANRRRLLLAHEYEQMALQEFPEIAKVKCLPGIDPKQQARRTIITLAVLRIRKPGEYPLCTDELLCQIETLLSQYTSPFVCLDAINPVYEEVTVFCGVSLKSGEVAGSTIQEVYDSLRNCIAPWDKKGETPVFGYTFSLRDMLSRVKEDGKVESVHGLKLLQMIHEDNGKYHLREYILHDEEDQTVTPSVPWGILIPASRLYVKVMTEDQWNEDIGFGDLEVENTFALK